MRTASRHIVTIFLLIIISSCRNPFSRQESFFSTLQDIAITIPAEDGDVIAPVSGEFVRLPRKVLNAGNFGVHSAIKTSILYYLDGKEETAEFIVVLGNLSKVLKNRGLVRKGELIGETAVKKVSMLVMSETNDPFLIYSGFDQSKNLLDRWWFNGDFLMDDPRDLWMTYKSTDSAAKALSQMLDGGTKNRYRLKISLAAYPEPIPLELQTELSAYMEYRTGVEEVESMNIFIEEGITFTLFWPHGYDQFLRDEYRPGNPLWLFCTIIPSDLNSRSVYIFVKDFQLPPTMRHNNRYETADFEGLFIEK